MFGQMVAPPKSTLQQNEAHDSVVIQKIRRRLPNIDPNVAAEDCWNNENWDRTEFVLRLAGTTMTTTHLSTVELFKITAHD